MLVRFEVSNFRSIAEPVELSMVAVDQDRPAARAVELLGDSVLTRAGIYGPNASGKSNVLAALAWLAKAVESSLRDWDEEVPVEPFAFGEWPGKPTELTLDYLVDGVRFEYLLEVSHDGVQREELYHYPAKRARLIFERVGNDAKFAKSLGSVPVVELMTPTTLLLSLAMRFDVPLAADLARPLSQIQTFGNLPGGVGLATDLGDRGPTTRMFDRGTAWKGERPEREQALALLQLADLGITDVVVEREEAAPAIKRDGMRVRDSLPAPRRLTTRLLHSSGGELVAFPLSEESQGTRTWYSLIGPVLRALRLGVPVVFDELDASLHPVLSAELMRLFGEESTNPLGSQLIFCTHDTSLLGHLNRDEVWLTQKRPDGSTELGALAEFAGERVRKSVDLETAYLHGRFGALPDVNRVDLLHVLGLIG